MSKRIDEKEKDRLQEYNERGIVKARSRKEGAILWGPTSKGGKGKGKGG